MRKLLALVALVLTFASAGVHAATIVALDLPTLIEQSDLVVLAHVDTETSRYVDGLIVTDTNLRVVSALKGSVAVGSTVTATHLGGSVGSVELTVPGAARFAIGQNEIVFLRRAADGGAFNVTGMTQGVMPINGSGDSAIVVTGNHSGATLMERDSNGAFVPKPNVAPTQQTLSDLLANIRRIVAGAN
ncbi:MAG TPA: hypothetical protein VHZ95_03455 [Polyangiales bacterium]|jgi:hypothetical protein|nr:hypothetical protein [Polyangiales bacterium]